MKRIVTLLLAAGLVLGALYTASPAQDGLSVFLQPTPIAILEE